MFGALKRPERLFSPPNNVPIIQRDELCFVPNLKFNIQGQPYIIAA